MLGRVPVPLHRRGKGETHYKDLMIDVDYSELCSCYPLMLTLWSPPKLHLSYCLSSSGTGPSPLQTLRKNVVIDMYMEHIFEGVPYLISMRANCRHIVKGKLDICICVFQFVVSRI